MGEGKHMERQEALDLWYTISFLHMKVAKISNEIDKAFWDAYIKFDKHFNFSEEERRTGKVDKQE